MDQTELLEARSKNKNPPLEHPRRRPGQGAALLHRSAGLREEGGGPARRAPLADRRLTRRAQRHRTGARARFPIPRSSRSKRRSSATESRSHPWGETRGGISVIRRGPSAESRLPRKEGRSSAVGHQSVLAAGSCSWWRTSESIFSHAGDESLTAVWIRAGISEPVLWPGSSPAG
jgi:hypothetical protein